MTMGRATHCKTCGVPLDPSRPTYYGASCGKCKRAYYRNRSQLTENRLKQRAKALERKFNITDKEYERILEFQGGGCALCGRPPPATRRHDVDHDHKTGQIRGLLCTYCNHRVVGRHGVEEIRRILSYLEDPPAGHVVGFRVGPVGPATKKKRRKRRAKAK